MSKDGIGSFLEDRTVKMAEIAFPSVNMPVYQEDNVPSNSGDLLQYAEPWGGPQNVPYVDITKPNNLEQDHNMMRQGERPETFQNLATPEEQPVSTTNAWGQQWEMPNDPAAGEGVEPQSDTVYTKPRGDGSDPFNVAIEPLGIGEPYEHRGEGEEQTFSDRVYVYASGNPGDKEMKTVPQELINRVIEASLKNGSSHSDNPHRMKVASLADLYSFDRVSSQTLVHKSSKELWSISVDGDGSTVIEKQFNDDGSPVKG